MTEAEWLASADPAAMLRFLTESSFGPAGLMREDEEVRQRRSLTPSARKLRLFACACCRAVWHLLNDERSRKAVEVAERFADGGATRRDLDEARRQARVDAGYHSCPWWPFYAANPDALEGLRDILAAPTDDEGTMHASFAALLREIVGNPWRAAEACRGYQLKDWITPTVLSLARAAYEERPGRKEDVNLGGGRVAWGQIIDDGTLDPARLAVLSDALEEAGCDDETVLGHLRSPGPHVRGCHVLDLILGKE
jgi:hypothetical protein